MHPPHAWAELGCSSQDAAQELGHGCRDGCREPGVLLGEPWGQPAPACPAQPFPVAVQTALEHSQGSAPSLQQHPVPPGAQGQGKGQQQEGLNTLLHFGYKSQGVKFSMPAPPSAGDFFFPLMPSCFSESGNVSVLFT